MQIVFPIIFLILPSQIRSETFAIVRENGVIDFVRDREKIASVQIALHGENWALNTQNSADEISRNDHQFSGKIAVPNTNAKLHFTEKIHKIDSHLAIDYNLKFRDSVRLNGFQIAIFLNATKFQSKIIRFIGSEKNEIIIPDQLGKSVMLGNFRAKRIEIDDLFAIEIDPENSVFVQDNRNWGADQIELRFNFHRNSGETVNAETEIDRRFTFRSNPPIRLIDEDSPTQNENSKNWIPFTLPMYGSPIDLSFLNEKSAGTHGFLTVKNDQFVFEDGTPIRFWGVNFTARANFPTHDQADKIAKRLAKFGVNIVRLHHADAGWSRPNLFEFDRFDEKNHTRSFDPISLDRYHYFIASLKREGIYIYLDQLVHRKFRSGDDVSAFDQLENAAKPYSNFDPRLIELQKEFSRQLWTTVNPHTKLAPKDDPAIVLMEFANENDLFTQKVTLEPYRSDLETKYRKWATENGFDLPETPIDFTKKSESILRFFHEIQRNYYREMTDYLRDLGVKIPITGSNWSRSLALTSAISINDYTDSHAYWDHPSDRYTRFHNREMVSEKGNIFASLTLNRVIGKPFVVSEWDQPYPNEWRAELPLAISAVAAFQNWNGLIAYTYRHNAEENINFISGPFDQFNDPARFGLFYHGALIFRRGDVDPAKTTVTAQFTDDQIFTDDRPFWEITEFTAIPEKHRVEIEFVKNRDADKLPKIDGDLISSDTDQLYRNWRDRYGTINTPKTKVAYGFLGDRDQIRLSGVDLKVETDFATIAVSSLDNSPISTSRKILITAVGRADNTDFIANFMRTKKIENGKAPILIEPIRAKIQISTQRKNMSVSAINADGKFIRTLRSDFENGILRFEIGEIGETIYYLIAD